MVKSPDQQTIREMAYLKWEEAGRPADDDIRFWLESEKEYLDKKRPEVNPNDHNSVVDEASEDSFPSSDPPSFNKSSA